MVVLRNVSAEVPRPLWCPSLVGIGLDVQHGVEFLGRVPEEALQITHKAVHIAFTRCLVDDVFVIIVAEAAAQFLIIHLGFVFPFSPSPGHLKLKDEKGVNTYRIFQIDVFICLHMYSWGPMTFE